MKKQGGLLRKAEKVILILLLAVAGFFYFGESCLAVDHLVINEVYYDPTEITDTGKEWIELYNGTANPIELIGYDLNAVSGDYYTFPNFTLGSGNFVVVHWRADGTNTATDLYTGISGFDDNMGNTNGWAALFNSTAHSSNTIIDYVEYGAGGKTWESDAVAAGIWTAGDYMVDVDKGHSFARKLVGFDTNQSSDFEDLSSPNPQNSGVAVAPPPPPPPAGEPETSPPPSSLDELGTGSSQGEGEEEQEPSSAEATEGEEEITETYKLGDVVINELVSDPADEEVEWIELYNITSEEIDLAGWTIEEGSGAKTNLFGILGRSGKEKFFIIEKPKGNLNNKGDIVILRAGGGILIDQMAYGSWDDGNINNNALVASDPYSTARKFDGQNSFNNLEDFAITATLTKGTSNIITKTEEEQELVDEVSAEEKALYDYSDDIVISEIFPNPVGSDNEAEFIELYNKGEREVNLFSWEIGDDSQRKYKFKDNVFIKVGQYLAVLRPESKIALNNGGDKVKLYLPLADSPRETVEYNKAEEGWSYNHATTSQEWIWSEITTPGEINTIKAINHPPLVSFSCSEEIVVGQPILFDSSDTIDEDGDELEFNWDFGDGIKLNLPMPEHTYLKEGSYTIKLIVSDGENEMEKEEIIKVISSEGNKKGGILLAGTEKKSSALVIVNEILPNPEGSDAEGEWVELKNISQEKINLLDWQLDDGEAGSKPYRFDSDLWLEPGSFYAVDRADSGLALNNSNESVRLFDNLVELIDEVYYEKSFEGESYARGENNKFFWTTVLTPGEENIISVAGSKEADIGLENSFLVSTKEQKQIIETTLEKIKELESGELVKVNGVVAVEPGILGAQYFYIVGSPGVQVYNYNKEFPSLKIGDYIEVSGEISISNGEKRIKTKEKEDMKIIEHRSDPIPEELAVEKITDDYLGNLVFVTGEITDKKGSTIYLDDGTEEIRVYIKEATGINSAEIKEGETLAIAGLVSRTESGLRIMPRSAEDIIKKDSESQGQAGQVLGEVAESDEWSVAARDKKLQLFRYLLVLAGGVIVVLGGLLIKELRKNEDK